MTASGMLVSPVLHPQPDYLAETGLNTAYRKVLQTTVTMQVVAMSVLDTIPAEIHMYSTQFVLIDQGRARVRLDGQYFTLTAGQSVVIPPGSLHQIDNVSNGGVPLKLITIYSPPLHDPREFVSVRGDEDE